MLISQHLPTLPLMALAAFCCADVARGDQTCSDNMQPSAPDSRFAVNADGTVLDSVTGLTWKRCAEGQSEPGCGGSPMGYTWQEALQLADQRVFAGYSDWRLPNVKELQSLIEQRCYGPSINLNVFENTASASYWSASPYAQYSFFSGSAWFVEFEYGIANYGHNEASKYSVRLVRDGS